MNADYPFVAGIKRFLLDESIGNATVLDPLELFQKEEAAGNHVYFQNDSHLNNYGKRVLAEFISEQIQAD